jgi:hypothetical protein
MLDHGSSLESAAVSPAAKPRFVDIENPALAIECPKCGLTTPRFLQYCKNCGFALWPSGPYASAAFKAWRAADPSRAHVRRYDLEPPHGPNVQVIDYEQRAHQLGIHLFPASNWPIVICVGFLFLALAAIPFPSAPLRIGVGVVGLVIFLLGVFGWVALEDVRMFPQDGSAQHGHEER